MDFILPDRERALLRRLLVRHRCSIGGSSGEEAGS